MRISDMIREINRDITSLKQKSTPASKKDLAIATDLLDTLEANKEICVGLAANMIGEHKNIIACRFGELNVAMINPKITKKFKPYQTKEGCLSLDGTRPTKRFENIEVTYFNIDFQKQHAKLDGFNAQIVQHELDHCQGIII